MSISRQRLWRRIWWKCYTRDRLLAIGTRRPLLMSVVDVNIPMFEVSDFETAALPLELNYMLGSMSVFESLSTRILLAGMCVQLTKLSACVGRILETQYSVPVRNSSFSPASTILLAPKTSPFEAGDIERCESDLEAWFDNLPAFFRPERQRIPIANQLIHIHRAFLACLYSTAVTLLHRPQSLPPTRTTASCLHSVNIPRLLPNRVHSYSL